jgi:uncharacterized membrane protein
VPTPHALVDDHNDIVAFPELAAAALGVALIGAAGRGRAAMLYRLAGVGLIGYALRPFVTANVRRAADTQRRIDAHGSVEIQRPIDEVFSFFKDFESFPRIAGGLRSVVDYQDGRSHWEAYVPSGGVAEWDVVVTKYFPRRVIGWQSVPGSDIDMRGVVRFASLGPDRTRIDVDVFYRPNPALGNRSLRSFLRRRHGPTIEDALERLKFYLESLPRALVAAPNTESGTQAL